MDPDPQHWLPQCQCGSSGHNILTSVLGAALAISCPRWSPPPPPSSAITSSRASIWKVSIRAWPSWNAKHWLDFKENAPSSHEAEKKANAGYLRKTIYLSVAMALYLKPYPSSHRHQTVPTCLLLLLAQTLTTCQLLLLAHFHCLMFPGFCTIRNGRFLHSCITVRAMKLFRGLRRIYIKRAGSTITTCPVYTPLWYY